MECFVCRTCAVQYKPSESPPDGCTVCEDERQYVGWHGQRWTTVSALKAEGLHCEVRTHERDLTGICATPKLGIGQRSLLVQTEAGNVLWDCQGFIDDETVEQVRAFGGIAAISASHPHFYGCMVEWSRAFGGVPIHLPRADARWVMRPDPAIRFWEGRLDLLPDITLVQCGGHFEGSSVLHWSQGAEGRGVLLVGDTIQVVSDRRFVSYPNLIPLPAALVRQVVEAVTPLDFDRIYGGWWDLDVTAGAKQAVTVSAERYLARMGGEMAASYGWAEHPLSWELLGALGLAMVVDRTKPMPTPELDKSTTLLVLPWVLDGAVDALVGRPTSGQAPAREAIAEVLPAGGGLPAMVVIASLLIRLEG